MVLILKTVIIEEMKCKLDKKIVQNNVYLWIGCNAMYGLDH